MNREQILSKLLECVGDGLWVMAALQRGNRPINKERLRELTNSHYLDRKKDADIVPIRSRHTLDQITARLEGAGVVEISGVGRAKMYSLSDLGKELISYREQQKSQ